MPVPAASGRGASTAMCSICHDGYDENSKLAVRPNSLAFGFADMLLYSFCLLQLLSAPIPAPKAITKYLIDFEVALSLLVRVLDLLLNLLPKISSLGLMHARLASRC